MSRRSRPLALFVLAAGLATGLGALAAPASAGVAVLVQYLDVPPVAAEDFERAITGPVRQRNLERLERKEIFAWYHYRARFPSGTANDYSDVVVTVFTDFASLEAPDVSAGYAGWVHDSEVYQGVPGIRSKDYYGKVEFSHITVDFMTAGPAGAEAFLATMRDSVMPRLQARADAGEVVNWALFERRLPVGAARGYEYALVSRYDGFGGLATPRIPAAAAGHLRQGVAWQLMDIVE